jgi:hypothetical protein
MRWRGYALAGMLLLVWGAGVLYQNAIWYRAGEEARSVLAQIGRVAPLTSEPMTIYFAGAPSFYDTALLFNTGLPLAMRFVYEDAQVSLHEVEQTTPDPVIADALATPRRLAPNPVFLGYREGAVVRYPSLDELLRTGVGKE